MVFVVEHWSTNILPTNEATLPTFTCCASSNHEYINLLNIAATNIFTPAIRSVLRSAISFWSIFDFIVQASPRHYGNSSPRRGVTMSPSRHDNVLPRGDVSPGPVVHPVTSSPRKNVRGSFMNRPAHTSGHAHTSSLKPHPLSPAAKVATYCVAGI